MNRFVLLCCILAISALVNAQQKCVISCYAPDFKNQRAILYTYDDYFSDQLKELEIKQVGENGVCTFQVDPLRGFKSFIQIQDKRGYIYIDPQTASYKVYFPNELDSMVVKKLNNNTVRLVFDQLPKNDLNTLILEFNLKFDYFLYGDTLKVQRLMMQNQVFRDSLAQFTRDTYTYYKDIDNRYFTDYMKYSIASIALFSDRDEPSKNKYIVFETFIKNQPLLYHNDAYMFFIKEFYQNVLSDPSMLPRDRVTFAINNLNSLEKLHEAGEANYYLKHPAFREFIFLNGLSEAYHSGYFNRENLKNLITKIGEETKVEEHKKIAKNILYTQNRLLPGTKCPELDLINSKGDTVSLEKFKGKYVYINFWATWNAPSVQDLLIIKMLQEKHGKYIEFISVSLDENELEYKKFLAQQKDIKWNVCHYNGYANILNDFDIRNIPLYVLVDENGNIEQFPALAPSPSSSGKSIDETMHYITRKLEPVNPFKPGNKSN
jgi:thiol-disulfide isomerase/thioredoxin